MYWVTPVRAGLLPVMMLTRVGEHIGLEAYARSKRIPYFENASILGVS